MLKERTAADGRERLWQIRHLGTETRAFPACQDNRLHSRDPSIHRVDEIADLVDLFDTKIRKVADIETEKMNVIRFGKLLVVLGRHHGFQVWLAKLGSAARAAPTELYAGLAKRRHETFSKIHVRISQHEIEGIVAGARGLKIRAKLLRIYT